MMPLTSFAVAMLFEDAWSTDFWVSVITQLRCLKAGAHERLSATDASDSAAPGDAPTLGASADMASYELRRVGARREASSFLGTSRASIAATIIPAGCGER
jgi:hypothetical protein